MQVRIILFFFSLITWVLLNWTVDIQNLIAGLLISIFVSFVTAPVFGKKPGPLKNLKRYFWFLYYIPLFSWECLKANIDGAYRVIHPDIPMRPGIVKVKTVLKSETGLTFLANTLTLIPGTMTIDVDKENGFLYVHWVDVKFQETDKATVLVVEKFESILKRIFE